MHIFVVIFLYIILSFSLNHVSIRGSHLLECNISLHHEQSHKVIITGNSQRNGLSDIINLKYFATMDTENLN